MEDGQPGGAEGRREELEPVIFLMITSLKATQVWRTEEKRERETESERGRERERARERVRERDSQREIKIKRETEREEERMIKLIATIVK